MIWMVDCQQVKGRSPSWKLIVGFLRLILVAVTQCRCYTSVSAYQSKALLSKWLVTQSTKTELSLTKHSIKTIKISFLLHSLPQPLPTIVQCDTISCFYLEAFTPSNREQVTDCSLKRALCDSPLLSLLLLSSVVLMCTGGMSRLKCVRSSLCQLFTLPMSLLSLACCQTSSPTENIEERKTLSRRSVP